MLLLAIISQKTAGGREAFFLTEGKLRAILYNRIVWEIIPREEKQMKRILSLILSLAMVLSMVPAQVFAEETGNMETEPVVSVTEPAAETKPAAAQTAEAVPEETVQQTLPEEAAATDAPQEEAATSGTCGEGLTWALNEAGVLTVTGSGAMDDFAAYSKTPWYGVADRIKAVVLENGVTSIGAFAFGYCENLAEVSIPDSVLKIGENAFSYCSALKEIVLPAGITTVSKHAFYYCTGLTAVTLPEDLNTIGEAAFLACTALTEITIPDSVTTIGDKAFQNCSVLETVAFGKNVTRIGESAFYVCKALTAATLPDGLTSIGEEAFRGCEALVAVDMPATVEFIGNGAFAYCENLTEIVLPAGLDAIGSQTFLYCKKLDGITIPEGLGTIGVEAFGECAALSKIRIPASVHTIGENAFRYCGLERLSFAGSLSLIGNRAFYMCLKLAVISFSGDAPTFTEDCFEEVTALAYYPKENATWTEDKLQNYGGTLTWTVMGEHADVDDDHICDCGCGEKLSECTDADFNHECDLCGGTVGVHADENKDHNCDYGCAESIGAHADTPGDGNHTCDYCGSDEILSPCAGGTATCKTPAACEECGAAYGEKNEENHESSDFIYTVHENGTHTKIHACCEATVESVAHAYTDGRCECGKEEPVGYGFLDKLYWELDHSGKMTVIGEGAIEDGSAWAKHAGAVKTLQIDSRITAIGEDAFAGFAALEKLSFPGTAPVAKNAFSGCAKLRSITLTGTGPMADYEETTRGNLPWFCSEAENLTVTLEKGLTGVGSHSFCGAVKVTAVALPEGLATIGDRAFRGSGLKHIAVPATVTQIGVEALSELKNCVTLELPDSVVTLSEGALSGSGFQTVKLPGNLAALPDRLLSGCAQLNNVTIPDTVTVIGKEAFRDCKALMGIRIPENVTFIEAGAFQGCSVLYNIVLPETLTEIGANAFNGDAYLVTVTIKGTVLTVGENAFSGCVALAKVYFGGSQEQWNDLSIAAGNEPLTKARVKYGTASANPVQQLHILHKAGLQVPVDTVLDGKNILVDMSKGSEVTLGYSVWPADAENADVIWDNNNREVVDAAVDKDGTYTLTGKQGGDVTVIVMNYGSKSGSDYTYANTALRLQFRKMVLTEDFSAYLMPGESRQMAVRIEGDDGLDRGIVWELLEDQTGQAVLTPDGCLTAGKESGKITLRAKTTDGSGLELKAEVTVSEYAVVISGPDQVASGKFITLTAELVPFNQTNTEIIWELKDINDRKYVTLSGDRLTAELKAEAGQTEKREIVVLAYSADGKATQGEKTVTVVPVTASVAIFRGAETVTGKTVPVNLNTLDAPLVIAAVTAPVDASKAVKWTNNDSKGVYAKYTAGEDGTYTLEPTGKTGTVTLTATAADGSRKKATVKLQLVRAAKEIEILNNPGVLRAGSKLKLTSSVATEAGLTDRNVQWSLSPESLPYASINAKTGALTTYAYPGEVTIKVRAAVKSDQTVFDEQTIALKPGATAACISRDGVALRKNEIVYVSVGESVTLKGSTLPGNAIQAGTWKVSGKGATWKDNGDGTATVTMTATGTATVTFTAGDGSKKSLSVKVQAVQRGGDMVITEKNGKTELHSGRTLQLTATVPGATLKKFAWSVDKPEFATVTNGKVKALTVYENTTVTVTATAIDGSKDVNGNPLQSSYTLLLKPAKEKTLHIKLDGRIITGTTQYLSINGAGQELTAEVYNSVTGQWTPAAASLTISGKKLILDGTTVKGLATGSGTVTAKQDGLTAKVTFKVVNPVDSITLSEKNGTYHVTPGKSLKLTATVTGANGTKPTVSKLSWSVDDPTAATVSASGVVKPAKTLTRQTVITVTATATDGSGVSATRQITLYPLPTAILVSANGVVLNQCVREFKAGDTLVLGTKILPEDAMQDVTCSISSGKLAALSTDENGNTVLKLTGKGNLTIKVSTHDGSKRTVSVKIKIV